MNRLALTLLASLALAGFARHAAAQTTTPTTTSAFTQNLEVWVDGDELKNESIVYIGNTRCKEDTRFRFRGSNYNTGGDSISTLEIWASSGGANCQMAANRAHNENTTARCWLVASVPSVTSTFVAPGPDDPAIMAPAIFKAGADDDSGKCPEVTNTAYTVYFVPLSTPSANDPSNPPEPIATVQKLQATLTLNQLTPSAPDLVKSTNGETELRVTWSKASDAKAKSEYYVLWDLGVGPDDSSCSGSVLEKDQPPPDTDGSDRLLPSERITGTDMTLDHLDERGVALGDYVAATVIHRDVAGNVSNQSARRCLKRSLTCGFECQCERDPECSGGFHTCALTPGERTSGALLGVLMALGSTLFLRRRRA